ncbi:MAG: sigma-70 family RNA polymerase sigma factor [Verrucomicrobia bacterium]|nr:sigma-70 family RNA polymerase sigma factor [Verrucomicrobiota bacterium]
MQLEISSSLLGLAAIFPALSAAEEQELARSGCNGSSDAHERIILCNLRLVVSIARDYLGLGLQLEDLVSEGTTGLMKAVSKFDPDNGARFATYATWWIRHAILRALCNQARLIRLPAQAVARMARIRQVFARMSEQLGREPTQEEIADETGLKLKQIAAIQAVNHSPVSLDAAVSDEEDDSNEALLDTIADERAVDPASQQEDNDQAAEVLRLLNSRLLLTERERVVLTRRFGINTDQEESFESIGKDLGLTSERVRQLQHQGLAKLRRKLTGDNRNLTLLSNYLTAA